MANARITELPSASAIIGTELAEIVQGGINKKAFISDLVGLVSGGDDYVQTVVNSSGSTIELNLESKSWGNFSGDTAISSGLSVGITNEERAGFYYFNFEISTSGVPIDFGPDTVSFHPYFSGGVFTPEDVGLYTVHALRRFGTDTWLLTFRGVYSVGDALPPPADHWILSTGYWNDSEYWDDEAYWKD